MTKIDLIQPRHNYAPLASQEAIGHVYMPTSLLTVAARLLQAGVDVEVHDENIRPRQISSEYVGINLLGAPYIPEAINLQNEINREAENVKYVLGGQVISGLSQSEFRRLFGDSAHNGNDDGTLASLLGINPSSLIPSREVSLIPAYEKIPDDVMRMYLSREFSFYVSQGCKMACDFCAATRTFKDPLTGEVSRIVESYRNPEIIRSDLEYLTSRARGLGVDRLDIYISNLDTFQSPGPLVEFAQIVQNVKRNNPGFEIRTRGLSRVDSFLNARNNPIRSIEELVSSGFHTVGFGVDGGTPEAWRNNHKGQDERMCIEAIRSARQDYGITPEALMVFGHINTGVSDPRAAYDFAKSMSESYGAIPRPHISKWRIPGNNGWREGSGRNERELFISNPDLFQSLDFTALPSKLTHPDPVLREMATRYFLLMCMLPGNTTQPVLPLEPGMEPHEIEHVRLHNLRKYDR